MAVVSLQTVGTILVIAMLITPAATAYLLTNHLLKMIITAAGIGMLSAVVGVFSVIVTIGHQELRSC